MRIFLQYAKYHGDNITGQIEELNKLVLDYSIPCYNESVAYLKYIRDQSSLVVPLEREAHRPRFQGTGAEAVVLMWSIT
jgi:hypothetical protein